MFTGLIEELGTVAAVEPQAAGARLRIACRQVLTDAVPGASIAVNGVCLTAAALGDGSFTADLAPETLRRTNLGDLRVGARVNLERPLAANGRFGGHIVQGHVDGTGELIAIEALGSGNWWLRLRIPPELDRYLVEKGSVAADGISLTVAGLTGDELAITIIPHTYANTALSERRVGDRVNLEADVLAKHVEKLLRR